MSAFDLLTEKDKNLIDTYIHYYGPSQDPDIFDWSNQKTLRVLLNEWSKNKSKNLLQLFNNELILRRPYTYTILEEALAGEILKHLKKYESDPFLKWWDHLKWNDKFKQITLDPKPTTYHCMNYYINNLFLNEQDLARNAYQGEQFIVNFPSGKTLKVCKGMKPMKILARFIQEFNGPADAFEQFRIWHSQQLNQKHMDGELCLSIHPLDYMTMSDNNNDWTSCMRWTLLDNRLSSHGDYRCGTVSCMNSPYIIIAYLHNPNHTFEIEDNWEWNSKRWRELFIVQKGIINEIKGYPFQDENLTNAALMWIKELAQKNLGWEYNNEEINVVNELSKDENKSMTLSFTPGSFMYNDMGTLNLHRGRVNFNVLLDPNYYEINEYKNPKDKEFTNTFIQVNYGGIATCMCCGKEIDPEENEGAENAVFCASCDDVPRCPCCGEPIYSQNNMYYVEEYDDPICESCWEDDSSYDGFDYDTAHLISNMTEVSLLLGYNKEQEPIYYNFTTLCYQPEYNQSFLDVFYDDGLKYDYRRGAYIPITYVRPGAENAMADAFGFILDKDGTYNSLLRDYGVICLPEEPIIPEEE